jgi:biotin transporter BioY
MSPFLVSFIFSIGVCAWLYTKLQNKSGNNTEQTVIAVAVIGAVLFLISYTIFGLVL